MPQAISAFGASTKAKLSNTAVRGAPEDQLRAPLEALLHDLATMAGLPAGALGLVGESSLSHLGTRPDYAVTVSDALVGFIEVKAPGKGADPRKFADPHDKRQWAKLKSLPNLLYTDGNSFSLWRDGKLLGAVCHLNGNVETSGPALAAPPALLPIIADFLQWNPVAPRTAKKLAEISARLCRLLRDEVTEELARGGVALSALATEWRSLLFPQASDAEFADGYAQAVTFGLLVARARNIPLINGIDRAALELRKSSSLIATALRLLTDDPDNQKALKTSLDTLTRVLDVVDWPTLTKGKPDAWLYFYEDFLAVYDNALRKRTGSYYTPPEVVGAMVRLVDEALRDPALFGRAAGLAAHDVTVADPAVGTGTFLLGVLRKIAATIEEDQGAGAVGAEIAAAASRLIGFELQFGPFAVAQLRLIAEMQTLMSLPEASGGNLPALKLFVTDTLGDPYATQTQFSSLLAPIGQSRRDANVIKRSEPITVVIGNPPYKEKARGRGGWIEAGSDGRDAPMKRWSPPREWGAGAHAKHLKNLYIYFWRWATWKVFGTGLGASTGEAETDRAGIICFITVAGFLNGPGFQKMRDDLRRDCSEIWVIDASPEGHQPEVATRIFQGVQQPVCIVLAARAANKDRVQPARLRFRALPTGKREDKFAGLAKLSLSDGHWVDGPSGWRDPFLPAAGVTWAAFPALEDVFVYNGSGVMPGRTWVIAPDKTTLQRRWEALVQEKDETRKETMFHPQLRKGLVAGRHVGKAVKEQTSVFHSDSKPINIEINTIVRIVNYGFRSLDRQKIIADARVINDVRPILCDGFSNCQIYLTTLEAHSPTSGPAISFTGLIPDLHHYKGSFGGRAFPLWRDSAAKTPNIKPALLDYLTQAFFVAVTAEDVMAYLAAIMAHPAFTARFAADLVRPGLRVPLTADNALFTQAVALGREIVWLHCYGERFADPVAARPKTPPRLPKGQGPSIPAAGTIPGAPEPLPDTMSYDPATQRLRIGKGYIDNVTQGVWTYEVSGKNILRQWFSYRKLDRTRPVIGDRRPPSPLDKIQPAHWLAEYTGDLLNLLHVLGRLVLLEPAQADLLQQICAGPLLDHAALQATGALSVPASAVKSANRKRATAATQTKLFK